MTLNEWVGKREVLKAIMGDEPYDLIYSGVVPDFDLLSEQRIDEVFVAIKKMQQCRCSRENDPLANYYNPTIQKIENAYIIQDRKTFKEEVSRLMILIGAE